MDNLFKKGVLAAFQWLSGRDITIDGANARIAMTAAVRSIFETLQKRIEEGTAQDNDYEASLGIMLADMIVTGVLRDKGDKNVTLSAQSNTEDDDPEDDQEEYGTEESIRAAAAREIAEMNGE